MDNLHKTSILPPPVSAGDVKKKRSSNIELYRIITMLLIVAHHYVVNSGLMSELLQSPINASSEAMLLFGAWGKTGIDCFVFITGWFMCKSDWNVRKLLKLYLQVAFYALIIYGIFCLTGHETFRPLSTLWKIFPTKSVADDFISAFIIFYLFIPIVNILLKNLKKREHLYLVGLILVFFCLLPCIPKIRMTFNYVGWFICLYTIAAFFRFYEQDMRISHKQWGLMALVSTIAGCLSVLALSYLWKTGHYRLYPYFFLADSNKILSVLIAVTTFMWFKDVRMKYSKAINLIGASTFGILLIHANSETMRQWLWQETVDVTGHFSTSFGDTVLYAIGSVLIIFAVCSAIDILRATLVEKTYMNWAEKLINFGKNRRIKLSLESGKE